MSDASIVYLNGSFMPLAQASIPVLDRGFIFGDGVYEVIPVYSRRPFRMDEHLDRMQGSLDAVKLPNPHTRAQWRRLVTQVIRRNEPDDQSVYIQVTRGVAPRDHAFPKNTPQTVFLMSNPLRTPARKVIASGVACVTATDFRWLRCDVKSVSLLGNCLMRQYAAERGAVETIMYRDGYLTEASSSNVFVVRDGVILAPPKSHLMLPGITYDVVIELARKARLRLELREITEEEVRTADEVWVSSSTKEVLAVTTLDDRPVANGRPGPVFKRMHRLYQTYKATVMQGPVAGRMAEEPSLIEYPCDFPVKVMGKTQPGFAQSVVEIVRRHAPDFDPAAVEMRSSRQSKYLSLTVTFRATSREQVDALYRDLCDHPLVVMVL